MFERFSGEARDVVVRAHEEARVLRHGWIGTEHLLLGVVAGGEGARILAGLGLEHEAIRARVAELAGGEALDADALAAVGIDLEAVRAQVEARFGEGALDRPRSRRCRRGGDEGRMPFSARAKKALELSVREAIALGDRHIGTEHLLLGLARDDGGLASRVLADAGVTRGALAAVIAARRRAA